MKRYVMTALMATTMWPLGVVAQQSSDTDRLLKIIEAQNARIEALENRLKGLEGKLSASSSGSSSSGSSSGASIPGVTTAPVQASALAASPQPSSSSASGQPPVQTTWKGAPEFTSADGAWSFKPRGKIQIDAVASRSREAGVDYESGTEVRRIRLGMQGRIARDFLYVAELEFADKKVGYEDLYLEYVGWKNFAIRVGHHEAPVSLEDETSDNDVPFMERSPYNELTLGRSIGVAIAANGDFWSVKTGVFGEPEQTQQPGLDEGWRVSARATVAPLHDAGRVLHAGVSAYRTDLSNGNAAFRVRARPDNHLITPLMDTGSAAAKDITFVGAELAAVWGPFTAQTEWGRQTVDYQLLPKSDFWGGYGQVAWVITGELRPYSVAKGNFGRIQPRHSLNDGGYGAFELALRYSHLDLNDGAISGGVQDLWTLGLTWYPTPYVRLLANWSRFDIRDGFTVMPLGSPDHKGDVFGIRAQVDW